MADGRLVAEALPRFSEALWELRWSCGVLLCLAVEETKADAFSSNTEAVLLSSSPFFRPALLAERHSEYYAKKDQVYFIFNITFPKLPPHWQLAVRRRRYRKLGALVQGLEQSPAVLCSFQPAVWNDA